jgi:hypothetical protein
LNSKQIAGPDVVSVLSKKLPPSWRWLAAPGSSNVLGDRPGANGESKLGEFSLNALLAPKRILASHPTDQIPNVERDSLPPARPTS